MMTPLEIFDLSLSINPTNYRNCFNNEDEKNINLLKNLNNDEKKLMINIHSRKSKWVCKNALQNKNIEDIDDCLSSLLFKGILINFREDKKEINLDNIIKLMSLEECKVASKKMKFGSIKSKENFIEKLNKDSHLPKITKFFVNFTPSKSANYPIIEKLISCIKREFISLSDEFRELMDRILFLSFISAIVMSNIEINDRATFCSYIFFLSQQCKYPSYNCTFPAFVYPDQQSLIKAVKYYFMLCEMKSFVKKRNIPSIRDFIQKNYDEIYCIIDTLNNKDLYEISLDYHLRKMTWVSFIVSIYSLIANGFELSKEYSRAIESYKKLISLEYFGVHSRRGDWYERLTCILAINDKPSTIAYLKMAIDQKGICLKKQYKLIRRFLGLIKKNKIFQTEENAKYKESCLNIIDFGIHKEKDFVGKMISNCNIDEMMQKNSMYMLELSESQETKSSSYISELSIEQECITRVEEYALKKYLAMNIYNKGIHGENSTLTFYSGLLFWNEIYYDFIDLLTANDNGNKEDKHVFLSPFQSLPLDFFSNDFYDKRSEIFDKKIEFLIGLPEEGFLQFLKSSYQEHCNHLSGWVNWDMFESVDDVLSLAKCFGSKKLVNISAELIRNPHCLRSGMPDLILWNNTTYEYTFSEIKSTNDVLSDKQRNWIDILNRHSITVEVCYVNRKRKKPNAVDAK